MSKTRSEAERLLNTIVSSRVRLSALQGDSSASVEPSLEEDVGDNQATEKPSESLTKLPQQEEELFSHLPIEDELTEFEDPPLVLGIDPDPATETQHLQQTDLEDLHANVSVPPSGVTGDLSQDISFTEIDTPTHTPNDDVPITHATEEEEILQRTSEPDPEEADPFSFIDLIPPDPDTSKIETSSQEPKNTAPPVRTKPLMPLPSPEAAGAPPVATTPQPTQKLPDRAQALSTDGLARPKEVAPRLLDPDRATLEVDVYVEQDDDPCPVATEDNLPQLTDAPSTPIPTAAPKAQIQTESVFDIVSEGLSALNRGDLHTALNRLSDALDWEPKNVEALLYRGRCKRDQGDIAGAMSDFLKAENIAPHSCEPYVEIGDLFFAKKDYSRAITHYTEALSIHPGHAMALCRRGISHHHRKQSTQALDDLKGAKSLDAEIPNIDRYISMVTGRNRAPIKR